MDLMLQLHADLLVVQLNPLNVSGLNLLHLQLIT